MTEPTIRGNVVTRYTFAPLGSTNYASYIMQEIMHCLLWLNKIGIKNIEGWEERFRAKKEGEIRLNLLKSLLIDQVVEFGPTTSGSQSSILQNVAESQFCCGLVMPIH